MNREIKFRAFWKDTKEQILDFNEQYLIDACNGDEFLVQQFTGLKDKNGVEIYEGDIVIAEQQIISNFHYESERIVKWVNDDSCFGFYYPNGEKAGSGYTFCKQNMNELFEVIGNIFENPELLNGKAVEK